MIRRLVAVALSPALLVFAEKPNLEHVYPTAAALGQTNTINLTGKFEPWPPKAWCSTAGVEFSFSTNKGSMQVAVAPDAKAGPCLIRIYNEDGASDPAIFVISESEQAAEIEPNNHFNKPQRITNIPTTINGRLDKNNDVDSFAFSVKAGQWLDARLESHTLMSKLDAVLRLVTTNGYQIEWNHDFASFDPRVVWQSPYEQDVVLQVFGFAYPAGSEIVLSGGNGGVYQLAISVEGTAPSDLNISLTEETTLGGSNAVFGVIFPAGDEDKYAIALKKDEQVELRAEASEFGSTLDPWVKVEDSTGKELARNDDAEGSRDAVLEWKAPADGDYQVVVGSLTRRGEEDWRYRLSATKVGPDFAATLGANSIVLEPDGTNELKVSTKRLRGFTNELSISVSPLPTGVTVEETKVDAKSQEGTLKIVTKDAEAFNGPVKILVKDLVTNLERAADFSLVSRTENNGVPGGYSKLLVERTDEIWLTVKPAAGARDEKAAK